MKKSSSAHNIEFLLDNQFFRTLHHKLRELQGTAPAPNTFLRFAKWSADLDTRLPQIPNHRHCLLRDVLLELAQQGHRIQIILWAGSTINGTTGYKERLKALAFQRWGQQNGVAVYIESYKSVLGPAFGQITSQAVETGLNSLGLTSPQTNSALALGAFFYSSYTTAFGWGASTHQKIMIFCIDGNCSAIVGGFNLGSEYSCQPNHALQGEYWHDTALLLDDNAAIAVNNEWVRRWNKQGRTVAEQPMQRLLTINGPHNIPVTLVTTNSECTPRQNDIRDEMIHFIRTANTSIYIENYAFTDPALVEALETRLGQGNIDVVVMINHPKSQLFEANTTWSYFHANVYERLRQANGGVGVMYAASSNNTRTSRTGVTYSCWPYPHSKLAIFDDRHMFVGSANWTYRSMEYDGEISAIIHDNQTVARFRERLLMHWWPNNNVRTINQWIANALPSHPAPPATGYGIHHLNAQDFTDWNQLSYTKRAALRTAWQMF
jgi:hypothetical protein